jgi:predicted MFS family arabinose efflux permease
VDEWLGFLPAGIVEPLHAELGLSYAQVGGLLVALSAGGLLGIPIAVAVDHLSRRVVSAAGAFGYAACLFTFAAEESFPLLLLAAVLLGASSDAMIRGCEVATVELAGDDLERTLGVVNALGALGDVLGPATLATAAATGLGWRPAFAAAAVLLLAYGTVIATQPFPPPAARAERLGPGGGVRAVLGDRRVMLLCLAATVFSLLDEPFLAFAVAYLERDQDLSHAVALLIAGAAMAGGLVGFVAVALRRPSGVALVIVLRRAAFTMVVSIALTLVVPWVPIQAASAFAFGTAGGVFWVRIQSAILGGRPGLAGTTIAVWSSMEVVAGAFPLVVGAVADARGLRTGLVLYGGVAGLLALLIAMSASITARRV